MNVKIKREAFRRGILSWKLHYEQKRMYDAIKAHKGKKFVINCSRRLGKSFFCVLLALEYAFKNPNAQIKYLAPSQKQVKNIILPLIDQILKDCPKDLRPRYNAADGAFYFHHNTNLHLAGADKNYAEGLRGTKMNLGVVDEAGSIPKLRYVVEDILQPQTLTVKDSLIIMASTPPPSMAHDFIKYVEEASAGGYYYKATIYQNPMITEEEIREYAEEAGGFQSETFRREYMAELIMSESVAILPEFTDEKSRELVKEWPRPPYYDIYTAMDVGFVDYTGLLFAYYDFLSNKVIIEDEVLMNKMNTVELKTAIENKEKERWLFRKPYLRFSDIDLNVIHDLSSLHNIDFQPTEKHDLAAAVNRVRIMIKRNQILIHPRCKNLISQMKYGTWNAQRKQFERTGTFGHFDLVAALVYLLRNIQYEKNPYPGTEGNVSNTTHFIDYSIPSSQNESVLGQLVNDFD